MTSKLVRDFFLCFNKLIQRAVFQRINNCKHQLPNNDTSSPLGSPTIDTAVPAELPARTGG